MKLTGNTILITGGGSGIGRALAERLAKLDNTVIITGRRKALLGEVAQTNPGIIAYAADIADPAALDDLVAKVLANHPSLNVVIANAGIMKMEDAGNRRDLADARATIATNLMAPIQLIDGTIDTLRSHPDAALILVSSALAFVPFAGSPTYCATKAAIHSYAQSLRHTLAGKVEVTELVPPAVQTDLTPGQAENDAYMPLDQFANEVLKLIGHDPTPAELLVDAALFMRNAETEGSFEQTFQTVNSWG